MVFSMTEKRRQKRLEQHFRDGPKSICYRDGCHTI